MLTPKRVKRRRVQRGRMKGKATKGNIVTYGDYGLVALDCGWITSNQIEAAYTKCVETCGCETNGALISVTTPSGRHNFVWCWLIFVGAEFWTCFVFMHCVPRVLRWLLDIWKTCTLLHSAAIFLAINCTFLWGTIFFLPHRKHTHSSVKTAAG